MVVGRKRRKEWLLKNLIFSTTTMFQEGEEEWLRLERQRQTKERKKLFPEKSFFLFFNKEEIICMFGRTLLGQGFLQSRYIRFIVTEASNK